MTLSHPGISPTNDLVAKKIFKGIQEITVNLSVIFGSTCKKRDDFERKQHSCYLPPGRTSAVISIPVLMLPGSWIMALK